ncbi:major capsid protein [Bacteroides congonensis]|uniref:major capsid protein n=1 Tax=Bacteroides congonensis TaxID=1871006 RepID=UPI00255A8A50|nr:major capsid protein [Bacteroides congonensis]
MASYTGMSNLQNHPHRSGFDIGRKNAFTAKVGELLPVYWDISMPGDKYKFNIEYFTRTQPVETSAYTRLREYFDFYAVPLRLLWKSAPAVLTQMQDVNQIQALSLTQNLSLGTYLPSVSLDFLNFFLYRLNGSSYDPNDTESLRNTFGFNRADLSFKLLSYLGYGNLIKTVPASGNRWWSTSLKVDSSSLYTQAYIQNNFVNIFPILTYQKIYQDFFRWSQWEKANPSSYNVDYYSGISPSVVSISNVPGPNDAFWKSDTMFDLKYCNWNKDMLMGVLPNSQFGDVAVIDLGGSSNVLVSDDSGNPRPVVTSALITSSSKTSPVSVALPSGETVPKDSDLYVSLETLGSQMSVLALRQAEALQRWKEISQSGDSDYREQIRKHFGVNLPQALSNMCTYIGGISRNLDISEVVNNNLATESDTAVIAGKGVGAGNGSFTYTTNEHCVVMCIYHAVPLLDYTLTGQDGQLLVTDAESLPIPEFDNIGMEVLPMTQIFNSPKASIVNLFNAGYNPRYFNWKTKLDVVNGAFTTTLKSWVSPVTESLLSGWFGFGYDEGSINTDTRVVLNYKFFKVNPSVLDPIFGVAANSTWDTDQLLVNSYIGCYVARNLSRDGVPY